MFILHNYAESPYAEKIRLMLGYTGLDWQSVDVPPQPPRPSLDPLLGGYRRIPVMQDGADIYCDTRTIASEIAARTGKAELAHENAAPEAIPFIDFAEGDIFAAAIFAAPKGKMLLKMLATRGLGFFRFMADRAGAAKDGSIGNVKPADAKQLWNDHLDSMNGMLAGKAFLGGDAPDIQDFAAYHTVWIYSIQASGKIDPANSNVIAWRDRMTAFGHGNKTPLSVADALTIAMDNEPDLIAADMAVATPRVATIAPDDYMTDATTGKLVGENDIKWIIARETGRYGTVHIHFPKAGYILK